MTVNRKVQDNRDLLLIALRGDDYRQGKGGLHNYDPYSKRISLCCIGVGCVLIEVSTEDLEDESNRAYRLFMEKYDVSTKTKEYLIGMNDGGEVSIRYDRYGAVYKGYKTIRHAKDRRDFKFIARFLEILWALEDTEPTH